MGGLIMSLWERIKEAFMEYLERVAKENKEMFGNDTPDCCKMNDQTRNTSFKR